MPPRLRLFLAVLLALVLLPSLFLRDRGMRWDHARRLEIAALPVSPRAAEGLGPFRLAGAWELHSDDFLFGGYSALIARPGGRLLALSDRNGRLDFREPPGTPAPFLMSRISVDPREVRGIADAEAATSDAAGTIWISWEDRHMISRIDRAFTHEVRVLPKELRGWSSQFGAESMARDGAGRFILVSEDFVPRSYERQHETLVYPSDPTEGAEGLVGPAMASATHGRLFASTGYRPTDMALLPDGRALILLRRLVWPLPLRFSGRIALADPAELRRTGVWHARDLAYLDPPLPTDNYEGLAVRPRADGKLDVWVIPDDNKASTQRTLLLKLVLDPADLPR